MNREIRTKLIELARLKTPWTYSQLNQQLLLNLNFDNGYDRELIGDWLGEISMHEYKRGRPLLSALIIHKSTDREQGNGFYKLCSDIYGDDWENLKADKEFEIERMKECYAFWKDNDNYKKFKNDV
ncbi:hypothetical protein HUK80_13385 [Flavobacterium sp. MAH-1]|uniref:Uncharacterized protein n=1 Tax=Flavobacterium agri TaxID=2743471 RepID=A0A7Y8Y5Y8_9FLAO|nr:hypothetical protein [Flavobacterium agri]NUY81891.1 hypothetical protein [Flavobacterium agri]NYA71915.1 hypothetical protein [Flavobacterium agri]